MADFVDTDGTSSVPALRAVAWRPVRYVAAGQLNAGHPPGDIVGNRCISAVQENRTTDCKGLFSAGQQGLLQRAFRSSGIHAVKILLIFWMDDPDISPRRVNGSQGCRIPPCQADLFSACSVFDLLFVFRLVKQS